MSTATSAQPAVIALDVNETLSDMSPLATRLEDVGAPGHLLATWFASTLRDGFALTAASANADFAAVARDALRSTLAGVDGLTREPDEATEFMLSGMRELPLHPDVRPGLERLHAAGVRLVTLTNGSVANTRSLLERGGVLELVERLLSVEEVRRWKPAPEPYHYAARSCGVRPGEVMLVAVHPWDVDGAKRAGLLTCWINRTALPYPGSSKNPISRAETSSSCRMLWLAGVAPARPSCRQVKPSLDQRTCNPPRVAMTPPDPLTGRQF